MDETLSTKQTEILSVLAEGRANPAYLLEEVESLGSQQQANYNLRQLRALGLVERPVQGLYQITDAGRQSASDRHE